MPFIISMSVISSLGYIGRYPVNFESSSVAVLHPAPGMPSTKITGILFKSELLFV